MVEFQAYNSSSHPTIKKIDDYNSIIDHAFEKPEKFLIRLNGSNYEVIHGKGNNQAGKILGTPSTNLAAQIQNAFTNLGATATKPEKVSIPCSGELNVAGSLPIIPSNNSIIQIDGYLKLADSMNKDMFENLLTPTNIIFCGHGVLDGNKLNQTPNICNIIELGTSGATYDAWLNVFDLNFANANAYAVWFNRTIHNRVNRCTFSDCKNGIIPFQTEQTQIEYNEFFGCDVRGIYWFGSKGKMNNNWFNYGCDTGAIYLSDPYDDGLYAELNNNGGNPTYGILASASALLRKNVFCKNNRFFNEATGILDPPYNQKIALPFDATSSTISPFGASASPVSATTYYVWGFDVIVTSTGGTVSDITIYDTVDNVVVSGLTTLSGFYIPAGYKIKWTYSVVPTVTVCGI